MTARSSLTCPWCHIPITPVCAWADCQTDCPARNCPARSKRTRIIASCPYCTNFIAWLPPKAPWLELVNRYCDPLLESAIARSDWPELAESHRGRVLVFCFSDPPELVRYDPETCTMEVLPKGAPRQ